MTADDTSSSLSLFLCYHSPLGSIQRMQSLGVKRKRKNMKGISFIFDFLLFQYYLVLILCFAIQYYDFEFRIFEFSNFRIFKFSNFEF